MIFRLSLKDDKESALAIIRQSALQKEGAACAKVLRWARKEVDKLQELRGGQCDLRAIGKGNTGRDYAGDTAGASHQD